MFASGIKSGAGGGLALSDLDWQNSVLAIADNTAAPPTEVDGDRYLLDPTGGGVHANWDGAAVNDVVEFNGTTWAVTYTAAGDEGGACWVEDVDANYVWDGTTWAVDAGTAHASSDGSSHSIVGLNATHRGLTSGNPHVVTAAELGLGTADTVTHATIISSNPPTDGTHVTRKDYVDGLLIGLDWQNSVIDIVDNTAVPPSEVTGERFLLDATGGGPHANWDGAAVNDIVEFDGSVWFVAYTAFGDEGGACWVEDEDRNYVWNGASWVQFGSTITHNNTAGLQGGTTDEYYHMTSAQHTAATRDATNAQNGLMPTGKLTGWDAAATHVSADGSSHSLMGKVGVDSGATPDYLGAASSDGALRTGAGLTYTDNGDYVTITPDLVGDGTAGRVLRFLRLIVQDGTNATTLKVKTEDIWNGDIISEVDNLGKGDTTGGFQLSSGGDVLYIKASDLTGNAVAGIASIRVNASGDDTLQVDLNIVANDIRMFMYQDANAQDFTTLVDTGPVTFNIFYITDA